MAVLMPKAVFRNIPTLKTRRNQAMSIHNSSQKWSRVLEDHTLENICNRRSRKLKEAKTIITKLRKDGISSPESLRMIDSLQRLGIDYHFQDDIKAILETHYDKISSNNHYNQNHDLSHVALCFRLLRQEGYDVPAEVVFEKFINKEGKFRAELATNMQGLMGLYEASNLSINGETILDEAAIFSGHFLSASVTRLADNQGKLVANTLKHPYHRTLARPLIRDYMESYGNKDDFEKTFKQLALFDFNTIQSFHREEIAQISLWWRDLGLASGLKFARDKPLDWFIWPMACFTDPSSSRKRVQLAKVISLLHLVIDVFDLVGTVDQLSLFVHAVNRWDIAAAEKLPDYMKICFKALYDITNEIAQYMQNELGYNPTISFQKEWSRLCNALLEDARWLASGKLPKPEEYLKNTIQTSGVNLVLLHTFLLLNENITYKTLQIVNNNPPIISSVSTILRLCNDFTSSKFGKQDWSYGSYMLCYMEDDTGSSVSDARKHVMNKISETWKHLNCLCLFQNSFSSSFIKAALNVARLAPFLFPFDYLHQDNFMNSLIFHKINPAMLDLRPT